MCTTCNAYPVCLYLNSMFVIIYNNGFAFTLSPLHNPFPYGNFNLIGGRLAPLRHILFYVKFKYASTDMFVVTAQRY